MPRDSIHISMSEPLRRAHVRPRLQRLADTTGLPVALVAARALVHGLAHIEGDLMSIFPATAGPTVTPPIAAVDHAPPVTPSHTLEPPQTTALPNEPPVVPVTADVPPNTHRQTANPQATAETTSIAPPTAPPPAVEPEPTPRAEQPARVTTEAAARALKMSTPALQQRIHRNPELRRHRQLSGRVALWDLPGLRAELAK